MALHQEIKKSGYLWPSIALTLWFIVITGLGFPLLIWGVGQVIFPHQANGSLATDAKGRVIGSELIGQMFTTPGYFHPRPSAAGSGYDAANSGGTNLGPTSDKLLNGVPDDPKTRDVDERFDGVNQLAEAYRKENGLSADAIVPVDAVTRSASGLDPDISPANARLQAARVAAARRMPKERVLALIADFEIPRFAGIFGERRLNVLTLNLKLDELDRPAAR